METSSINAQDAYEIGVEAYIYFYTLVTMDVTRRQMTKIEAGKRTTGSGVGQFALVPPGWQGELPAGMTRMDAPTPYIWLIGRTQTNSPSDYEAVHKLQDGYTVKPLSRWGKEPLPVEAKIDPTVAMTTPPFDQVKKMPVGEYFAYAAELMKLHPPHLTDWSTIARIKRIGLEPGKGFAFEKLDPAVKQALEHVPSDALKLLHEKLPTLAKVVNGWQINTDSMGVYGNFYIKRPIVAMIGLGANQPDDAIYPVCLTDADGKPLNGDNNYVLHFNKEELPPVGAFWSVAMYDEEGYQAANAMNRFAIGDRDDLRYNAEGSLDLYMQRDSPGSDKKSNWLPAPHGPLGVTMRLYAPQMQALHCWVPPAV